MIVRRDDKKATRATTIFSSTEVAAAADEGSGSDGMPPMASIARLTCCRFVIAGDARNLECCSRARTDLLFGGEKAAKPALQSAALVSSTMSLVRITDSGSREGR